jgi:3-methyladenine DNA glycosylase/8-oxoguanine DNA glycosylase
MTATVPIAEAATVWRPDFDIDVPAMVGSLRRGGFDPCHHRDAAGDIWRASRMPSGPVTYRLRQVAPREVHAWAWGAGAAALIAHLPRMFGADDDLTGFVPGHPLLEEARRRRPGLRVLRTGRVLEALIPAIIEQKITGKEAHSSWSWLVRRHGEPAPGPTPRPMFVPPDVAGWRRIPSWDWHRAGVDAKRSGTILAACAVAPALERTLALGTGAAVAAALRTVPGIGVWTAAEIAQRSHGDPDAISVGDYHLANLIGFALAGHTRSTDDVMIELLERYRPYRQRVVRLLELGGPRPPKFGPKLAPRSYADI